MRDIKFRAWDKLYNEMLHDIQFKHYDVTFDLYLTDRYVVMQYTGLKDRNGKEIYDGDIVKSNKYGDRMIVIWGHCAWGLKKTTGESAPSFTQYGLQDLYVIGNIYENNDLL